MAKVDLSLQSQELRDRVQVARRLVLATQVRRPDDELSSEDTPIDVSREARGLAILLLFAAYENLLVSTCRGLLEYTQKSRAHCRRLKPGLQLFLVQNELTSVGSTGRRRFWKSAGPKLVAAIASRKVREINVNTFPDDGSFMKSSQVALICELFELGNPAPVLREVWTQLDGIVEQRNAIAHGRETPEEIGRRYTEKDLIQLIDAWEVRWLEFLSWIEGACDTGRPFYLAH